MQSHLLRSFDMGILDSGGRYPVALDLAPDLPRDLLRYDSTKDPYPDMYRDEKAPVKDYRLSQASEAHTFASRPTMAFTHTSLSATGPARSKRASAPPATVPVHLPPPVSASASMPIPERVGIEFKVKKQGMFARGLQNLFSNSTSATAPDSLPHVRPRSLDDAQAFVPVAPFEQTPPLPALIPGSPCPSSCPPPLPPKPSSSPPGSRNSNINQVGMAKVEISPPVPPPPPLGPGQVAVDRSQNERQRQSIITFEEKIITPPQTIAPPGPMSRAEQWTRALKGQQFQNEDGMFGPYPTGSVVGNGFPPIIPIMDLKPDASTRKNSPRTTDKGTARAVPETAETSPKMKSRSRTPRTPKRQDQVQTPKSHRKPARSHETFPLGQAQRSKRPSSRNPSEHYDTMETAHAASLTKLEAHNGHPGEKAVEAPSKTSRQLSHSRHQTLDTDVTQLTQSTASFGHILHSNGQPLPVNMQTQAGLLPPYHRRQNSNGTPLGDIYELSEPQSSQVPVQHMPAQPEVSSEAWQNPIPTTGEAAKYYAAVETVSDSQAEVHSHAPSLPTVVYSQAPSHPTRQDSGSGGGGLAGLGLGRAGHSHMSNPLSAAFSAAEAEIQHSLNMLSFDKVTPSVYQPAFEPSPTPYGPGDMATPSYHPTQPPTLSHVPSLPPASKLAPTTAPSTASHRTAPSSRIVTPLHTTAPPLSPPTSHSTVRPDSPSTIQRLSSPALSKRSIVSPASPSLTSAPSIATAMVPHMVHRSSFHDETLCQLLDASRLNLLGDEAKKALMRAARARVVELKDIREKTKEMEKGVAARTEPLVIKKKRHRKKYSGDDSDEESVQKNKVEEMLEQLLEKQEVDQATRDHVCRDPANHSRCLSSDGEFERVEEDLYRGRVSPSREYRYPGPGPGPHPVPPPGPPPAAYPGPSPYQYPYMPQPYPVYLPPVQPMYQGYQQPHVQVQVHPPPQRARAPVSETVTVTDSDMDSYVYPAPRDTRDGREPAHDYRAGVQSRDSHDLMAEVLNIEYAGIPVKQILQDFLEQQQDMRPGSIHTIPPTPTQSPPMPSTAQAQAPSQAQRNVTPMQSPQSRRNVTPSMRSTSMNGNGDAHPASPRSNVPQSPSRVPSPSPRGVPQAPSCLPSPAVRTQKSPRASTHGRERDKQSSARDASVRESHREPRANASRTTSVDWSWEPEIKIRVQPPTTLSHANTTTDHPSSPVPPATPPPPTPMSPPSTIDYTASYLPLDRALPPLPASTYAPSVATGHLPSELSTATPSHSASHSHKMAPPFQGTPWELVAHRLYSWAVVWEDDYFSRALESISIGRPVDEFPLTVVSMLMFKRILQLRMTNTPAQACDKLFVPPNIAEAINKAVHAKQFEDAQALLEGMWYAFGLAEPPRVIISLVRHGAIKNAWVANRYDLVTHRFATYIVCTTMPTQKEWDGRPFMWWHAIRAAWPNYAIPDPVALSQVIKPISVPVEFTEDISLRAASIARNLLLGIRPEHDHDIPKLRKQAWTEVNRLHTKKKAGRLMVHT